MKKIDNCGKEDDYNPGGTGVKSDVPSLNDAIPVISEDFAPRDDEAQVMEIASDIYETGEVFEKQQDLIFDMIVVSEVAANMPQQFGQGASDAQSIVDEA